MALSAERRLRNNLAFFNALFYGTEIYRFVSEWTKTNKGLLLLYMTLDAYFN